PCRQPAAQRNPVRPADGAGGGQTLRPAGAGGGDGQGGAPRRPQADGGRHRHRQRRRAAPHRLPDLRAAADDGLCRRFEAPARARVRGISRAARLSDAPFSDAAEKPAGRPEAQADIKYKDLRPITEETAGFKRIADELGAFSERFMTAPSPGIISTTMLNAFYKTHDDYLDAIAREMKNEYQTIHKAGFILQIDAPDLAMD